MLKRIMMQTLFLLLSALLWSCSDQGVNPRDAAFVIPENNISFYDHIQPMLLVKCGLESGCHSAVDDNSLFYIELTTKDLLMEHRLSQNGEKLVDLSIHLINPHLAPLYLIVLEGYPDTYDRMPPYWSNQSPLNDNQVEGIKNWIAEGAQN